MEKQTLQTLVNKGYSQHKIANLLKVSQKKVFYWLKKYELKTVRAIPRNKITSCLTCNKTIDNGLPCRPKKYCSRECSANSRSLDKIKQGTAKSGCIRRYLIKTSNLCSICNLSMWNNKKLTLELDHIDGNSDNNNLENCRLLCPNCHSQTPTYKNKNKGKGRHSRRTRYKKGLSY